MSKEAMKLALEALMHEMKYVLCCINLDKIPFDGDDFHEALRLGEEALAKQEQDEPAAKYIGECSEGSMVQLYEDVKKGTNFYTTPQQRTWVGLTCREKSNLWLESRAAIPRFHTYATLIETKLKEKNT
jgi:hypothetical protein